MAGVGREQHLSQMTGSSRPACFTPAVVTDLIYALPSRMVGAVVIWDADDKSRTDVVESRGQISCGPLTRGA